MAEKTGGKWWKWALAGAVVALAAGAYYYFQHRNGEQMSFTTSEATLDESTATVTATGILNPVKSVQVGCQVSGRISNIHVDFNSQVKAGDLIAELDPRTYLAQVSSAEADLSNATANLELQQVQAQRAADLYTNQLVSGSEHDIAQATLHQAQAVVKIKQASLENAKTSLGYTKIYSPVDGVVISRNVDVGQTVAASFNTPTLFLIANDLTRMQIDAAVSEADVGGVLEGQSVDFTVDAYPNRTFHGRVVQVRNSPTTVNNVVTYDAVIGVTNADYKLKPGMTANVSIIVAQRINTLSLPNAAVRFRPPDNALVLTNDLASLTPPANAPAAATGGKGKGRSNRNIRTVYMVDDAKPSVLKPVQIKTGITDGISTEIVEGLKAGDKVVSGVLTSESPKGGATSPFSSSFPSRR
jgi:HlyD family secretion protein